MPWGPTHNPQEKEAARRAEAAEQQRLDALMEMERIRALEAYAVRGGVGGGETAECVWGGGEREGGRHSGGGWEAGGQGQMAGCCYSGCGPTGMQPCIAGHWLQDKQNTVLAGTMQRYNDVCIR